MNVVNHQFRLAARPVGMPGTSNWSLTEEPLEDPREGEFIVKLLYISLDPAMRGWMNEGKSYIAPVKIGEVMRALAQAGLSRPGTPPSQSATMSPGCSACRNLLSRAGRGS